MEQDTNKTSSGIYITYPRPVEDEVIIQLRVSRIPNKLSAGNQISLEIKQAKKITLTNCANTIQFAKKLNNWSTNSDYRHCIAMVHTTIMPK